jgi:hypothetical protein
MASGSLGSEQPSLKNTAAVYQLVI